MYKTAFSVLFISLPFLIAYSNNFCYGKIFNVKTELKRWGEEVQICVQFNGNSIITTNLRTTLGHKTDAIRTPPSVTVRVGHVREKLSRANKVKYK